MSANLIKSIGGILVCGYLLLLSVRDQLNFYIHPRYQTFTLIMAIVGIVFLTIDITLQLKDSKKVSSKTKRRISPASLIGAVILLLAYIIPPAALSPSSVAQRESPTPATTDSFCAMPTPSNGQTDISINRWRSALRSCNQANFFSGKNITVIGFVSRDILQSYGYDYFYVTRYLISCCAVDSVPVKLLVDNAHSHNHQDGTWIRVSGVLLQKIVNGKPEYVITNSQVTTTRQPSQPYELLGL